MAQVWILGGMLAMLVIGCHVSMNYYFRMRMARGAGQYLWMALASVIAGASGFTAHVVTIAVMPQGAALTLQLAPVVGSFLAAVAAIGLGYLVSMRFRRPWSFVAFGFTFNALATAANLGVLLTAQVQGTIAFTPALTVAGIALSLGLSVAGGYATESPLARWAGLGALAIGCAAPVQAAVMLAGADIALSEHAARPAGMSMDATMTVVLICATLVVMLVGAAGLMAERRRDREAKIHYRELAYTDALTGLRNRIGMQAALRRAIRFDGAGRFALLVFDLDKFKWINDSFGHAAGDFVLTEFARRLTETLPPDAAVGRFGGDEFVALLDLSGTDSAPEAARRHAAAALAATERPMQYKSNDFVVGTSIGIALAPDHADTFDALVAAADHALYEAKRTRGAAILYTAEIGEAARAKAALEAELRRALRNREFVLFFQSQVTLPAGDVTGYEALIRWQHPTRGLLAPDTFIPHAERSALISEIGTWVLNAACHEAAGWPSHYRVAVNVAARQLAMPDFVEQVRDALFSAGLAPDRLEIEVTEASVIEDEALTMRIMHALRDMGVRIVMDDYGTGFASLAALRTFPFDKLKIDRSFIEGLSHDAQSSAIIRSTLLLTKALAIPVTAEGVESQRHVDFLVSEGCRDVQGFFFSRPIPATDLRARLSGGSSAGDAA